MPSPASAPKWRGSRTSTCWMSCERMGVVVLQVIERRAPVPCLDIVGTQLDRRHRAASARRRSSAHPSRPWRATSTALRCRSGSASTAPRSAPRHAWRWPHRARPSARRTGNPVRAVRSAPTFGSLLGASGSFFCGFRRGTILGSLWRNARQRHAATHAQRRGSRSGSCGRQESQSHAPKSRRAKSRCKAARRQRPCEARTTRRTETAQPGLSPGGP